MKKDIPENKNTAGIQDWMDFWQKNVDSYTKNTNKPDSFNLEIFSLVHWWERLLPKFILRKMKRNTLLPKCFPVKAPVMELTHDGIIHINFILQSRGTPNEKQS